MKRKRANQSPEGTFGTVTPRAEPRVPPASPVAHLWRSAKLMFRKLTSLAVIFLCASTVNAGVTIHYEGTAISAEAIPKILSLVTATAKKNQWRVDDASSSRGKLERVIDEKDKDYQGRVTGVVVRIGDDCEPLHFQFGDDLFMQDFVKTQFARAEVHVQIVALLDSLRPYFRKLTVDDEGEFWEKRDRAVLEGHMRKIDSLLAEIKKKDPKAKGPVRLKSGRIADIIQ
jgi:hypothetical protein